ncbi:P-loop containing nucleoside triphosphate hydrolase protein, partial [Rickenella mellea]
VGTQFIFLSATWPVGMEYLLWERFGFDNRKLTRVIRARSTARLEISIHVKKVEDDEVEATVLDFLENVQTLKSNERGIIFCTTIADAQHYASLLGIPCYHGQLTEQEKTVVFHNWIAGEDEDGFPCQTVSATGAMGQGVDFPGVRYVVHVQPPYTFTDYVQQMGRAGRDGKPAISILI